MTAAGFGDLIAERIRTEHVAISARWLDRLRDLLPVDANDVFPTEHLLDHIPALIQEVAGYIQSPATEAIAANTSITSKAQELGELRHVQRASVHQLLAEYRVLGGILTHFVQEELERIGVSPVASEAIEVVRRVNDALWILMQTTVDTFVSQYTATIASHAARLESFNRMISHELRQPLGTLLYALPLVRADVAVGEPARRERLFEVMERNTVRLMQLMEQLESLSRLQTREADAPDTQQTDVAAIAWGAARQLREMAEARGVDIEVAEPLPNLVIDVARVELILTNLISNAIKYSDPQKPRRFVRVESVESDDPGVVCLTVRDNGLGIPDDRLPTIFRQFVRAHASLDEELGNKGSGLGLAIASECVEAIGGSIRAESTPGEGTSFFVTLPRERA
jgi:signal transduction histidine kinase